MPLLEAFLALALTLLSLAMIATLVVELIHRLAGTRAKNLKLMLEEYYDLELKPIVETEQKNIREKLEDKTEFIHKMLTNPLINKGGKAGPINSRLKELSGLSTEDLFKKLAYTNIGKRLKARAITEIDDSVDSLSISYDAFGVAATDLFKRKAQMTSLLVGVLVAFALNANALVIFKSYLDDPQARAKAVAQADAALENFARRTDIPEGFANREALLNHVDSIRGEIEDLGDMSVAIGYSRERVPASWFGEGSHFEWWPGIAFWALGVCATGLLIGLGGPFWFNVVRKLTDVLQVARGSTPTAAEPGGPTRTPTDPMKFNRDTFRIAGGSPPLIKAQAILAAASMPVPEADTTATVMGDALPETQDTTENNPV